MIWDDFRQKWLLCWLFPVFLQISGENPPTEGLPHLISDGRRTPATLIWQVMSYHPRGQGMGRAEKSPGAEHDFQPISMRGPLDASM